jgi:hypothetical protein
VTSDSSPVSVTAAGLLEVEVEAEGYRSEHFTVPAEIEGTYEVFLDPPDQLVDRRAVWTTGAAPKQVAFTPDGSELWVTLLAGSGLEVYDPANGALLAAIDLPEAGSVEVIFDSTGQTAFVSQMETASVYEIDVATRQIRRTLDTGGSWTKVMVLDPDGERLWASNWVSNDVSEFDLTTGEWCAASPPSPPRGDWPSIPPAPGSTWPATTAATSRSSTWPPGEGTVIADTGGAMRHLVAGPASGLIYASDMARDRSSPSTPPHDTVEPRHHRPPSQHDRHLPGRPVLAVSNRGRNNPETYYLPGPEWGSILLIEPPPAPSSMPSSAETSPPDSTSPPTGRCSPTPTSSTIGLRCLRAPRPPTSSSRRRGRADTYRNELSK